MMKNINKIENTEVSKTQLYFAYGSNMDEGQMARRCPGAKFVGEAHLDSYKFLINSRGVATVVPSKGKCVQGLLWSITGKCEDSLDGCEGVKYGTYRKEWPNVTMIDGKTVPALIYIARDSQPGVPRSGYLEMIISAARKNNFGEDYLQKLEDWKNS